jgi:hypothetical protein
LKQQRHGDTFTPIGGASVTDHPGCIFADHGNDQPSLLISPVA